MGQKYLKDATPERIDNHQLDTFDDQKLTEQMQEYEESYVSNDDDDRPAIERKLKQHHERQKNNAKAKTKTKVPSSITKPSFDINPALQAQVAKEHAISEIHAQQEIAREKAKKEHENDKIEFSINQDGVVEKTVTPGKPTKETITESESEPKPKPTKHQTIDMSEIYPEVAPDYDPEDSKRWHDELKDGGSIVKQARIETVHDPIIDIVSKIALGLSAVICILGVHCLIEIISYRALISVWALILMSIVTIATVTMLALTTKINKIAKLVPEQQLLFQVASIIPFATLRGLGLIVIFQLSIIDVYGYVVFVLQFLAVMFIAAYNYSYLNQRGIEYGFAMTIYNTMATMPVMVALSHISPMTIDTFFASFGFGPLITMLEIFLIIGVADFMAGKITRHDTH